MLDLACGRGRHALATAAEGLVCIAIDRDAAALRELCGRARQRALPLLGLRADLETPHGIPIRPGSCGAILVFRFLFRPLAGAIAACLRPGGLLLYETFTVQQRTAGYGPRNPAFLLQQGELPELFPDLEIVRYEELWTGPPRPEAVARLVARRPSDAARAHPPSKRLSA